VSPAGDLVMRLRTRGVELVAIGDRLRFRPAHRVTAEEREELRLRKDELLRLLRGDEPGPTATVCRLETVGDSARQLGLAECCYVCGGASSVFYAGISLCRACAERRGTTLLAYRDALRDFWRLTAEGERAKPEACRRALDEVVRLIDEAGEPRATRLRHRWENDWRRETGRCPRCGEAAADHTGQTT
jgi:tubulysin polyketide synthase-like protein